MTYRYAVLAVCMCAPLALGRAQVVAPPPPPPPPPPALLTAPPPPPPPAPLASEDLFQSQMREAQAAIDAHAGDIQRAQAVMQAHAGDVQRAEAEVQAVMQAHAGDIQRAEAEVQAAADKMTRSMRDQQGDAAPRITQFYQGDPADSLYRAAAAFYSRAEYRQAADRFNDVRAKYPSTRYFCDASYNEAFSRYQLGLPADLRTGKKVLDGMGSKCGDRSQDVPSLMLRINSALARTGDADAAAAVRQAASQGNICDPDDRAVKIAALNALAQSNDSSIDNQLAKVLAKTDHCSAPVRSQAIQIASRSNDPAAVAMLMASLKNDPEHDNKLAAVRALGSMSNDAAYTAMEELMRTSSDESVQRAAASAMAHSDNPRAQAAVRALIERTDVSESMRISAIQALGSRSCGAPGPRGALGARAGRIGGAGAVAAGGRGGRAAGGVGAAAAAQPVQGAQAGQGTQPAPQPQPQQGQAQAQAQAQAQGGRGRVGGAGGFNLNLDFSGFGNVGASGCSSLTADEWRALYAKMNTDNLKEAMINAVPRGQSDDIQTFLLGIAKNPTEGQSLRVSAFNRVKNTASIDDLMKVYETAESRSLRTSVVNGLGSRNEPEATDHLIEIAKTSTDVDVRSTAIRYLGQSNRKDDPKVKKALCEILGSC